MKCDYLSHPINEDLLKILRLLEREHQAASVQFMEHSEGTV